MRPQQVSALLILAVSAIASPAPRAHPEEAGAPLAAVKPPAHSSLFLYPERISFADGGWLEAERGVLYVPLRRSEPVSGIVGLEIYRFKALDPASVTPPIFVLHGGPGWPGLAGSLEQSEHFESRLRPLTRLADVVVVGQRGIGSSKPDTACEPPPDAAPDAVLTAEDRDALLRRASERCKAFWETRGFDLAGLTVVEAAADVDDVRRALGYEKIILWGGSFGSHWSMAVMRFHPRIVARAVLTGLEGPDHTYDLPSDVLGALERIAALADASPELRPFIPEGGLIGAFSEVVARIEQEPLLLTVTDPKLGEPRQVRIDAADVRRMAVGVTGSAHSRRHLPRWPVEILQLHSGDFVQAAEQKLEAGRGFPTASFFMLDCGSGISPARKERLLGDPAAEIVGPISRFYLASCPVWESDLGEEFRKSFETEIPTVLVHGNWDLSTPLENALELAPFFKNGKLVVVRGGTHGALQEALEASEGFRTALMRFVGSGDMSALPEEVQLAPIEWEPPEALQDSNQAKLHP